MKKLLKIAAGVVAVLVLVVAGGIAYVAATFDAARIKQELAAAVEKQTGRTLTIDGELALAFWPDVGVRVGHASLSERAGRQEFAKLDGARVAVAVLPLLSKQVQVKTVEIDGLQATVVKRKDGTLNVADLAAGQPKEQKKVGAGGTAESRPATPAETAPAALPAQLDIAAIRIRNAQFVWRDEQTGRSFSLADLDLSSGPLRMAGDRIDVGTFDLSVAFATDGRRLAASLAVAGITGSIGSAGALKGEKFSLETDFTADQTHAVARLASPVALDLEKQTVALPQLAGRLELSHPQLPMKTLTLPLSGAAQADIAKQSAGLSLATELDASHLKAKVDVARFAPLVAAFDLDIDRLDLDKYLPPEKKEKDSDGKIDLSALEGLDLKGTVKIGELKAARLKASNLQLKLDARDGKVNIAPLSANLYEGRLDGSLSAAAAGNRIAVKQKLAGVRVNPLLKDLLDKDILDGRGNVAVDVAGQGATVDALKKSLAGTAQIALADGAIKGIDIGRRLREAKALLAGVQDVSHAGDATQKTDFSELSASFRIAGGVAHNDDLMAKSPLLRLSGAGDIDIGNSRLDYLLKTSIVATSTGQGGKDLEHVKGLTIPVRLTGPFDDPSWKLEFASALGEAVKARIEAKTEAIKSKAEDKLKDKFKGLLGR